MCLGQIKCDETKRECRNCQKKGQLCPGYNIKLQWSTKYELPLPLARSAPINLGENLGELTYTVQPSASNDSSQTSPSTTTAEVPIAPSSSAPSTSPQGTTASVASTSPRPGQALAVQNFSAERTLGLVEARMCHENNMLSKGALPCLPDFDTNTMADTPPCSFKFCRQVMAHDSLWHGSTRGVFAECTYSMSLSRFREHDCSGASNASEQKSRNLVLDNCLMSHTDAAIQNLLHVCQLHERINGLNKQLDDSIERHQKQILDIKMTLTRQPGPPFQSTLQDAAFDFCGLPFIQVSLPEGPSGLLWPEIYM